jgi:hypothetical protein
MCAHWEESGRSHTLEIERKWSLFWAHGYYLCAIVLMEEDPISYAHSCFKNEDLLVGLLQVMWK